MHLLSFVVRTRTLAPIESTNPSEEETKYNRHSLLNMSLFVCYTVFLFFIPRGSTDSISLQNNEQSGSSLSDAMQKMIDTEQVISDEEKTSKEGNSVYNRGQLGFKEHKQDEKSYGVQDTTRKGHDKGRHSLGESKVVDHGRNSFERHGSRYYKKGHHRTGFSNNYHKDESGNNSSFYEDSDDEGGHRSSGNSGGYYGQKSQDSFKDGSRDASYALRDRTRQGIYDNKQKVNHYRNHVGGYNNDRYKDDRRNYLRDEARRYFDKNGDEIYYHKGKYHPITYRNNDHVPSSEYYVDISPRGYYREDPYVIPYSNDHRYFSHRQMDYEREPYYPYRKLYDRNYRDNLYDDYLNRYKHDFDRRYYGF